jgi:repressor LexA
MSLAPLTDRQKQVLDFISDSIQERGYPPTLREIGEHMSIRSTNGVNDHLKALERKGYLRRDDLKSRALRPVSRLPSLIDVPLVGRVAAGEPLLAEENIQDTVRVDRFFIGTEGEGVFALRVEGESMIDDGINDGDFIFVRKQLNVRAGDIVVVMIDGEATVKRYFPEGDRIRFQPANETMTPIYVHRRDFKTVDILGLVVGVYRRL